MKQLILLLVVAAALVDYSQAQGNRKCAANGEYCLTHSECCSGSCLSFSYKCVPVPPGASVGTVFVPAPPAIETDNRFGGGDDGGASITQKTCAKNGEYCLTHAECCSGSCLSFSYKCVPTQPGTSSVQQQPQRPQRPQSPPPTQASGATNSIESSTVDLGNRVGENEQPGTSTTATQTTARPPAKCAAVGEYCLTAADCCSRSCLSFSYKCVQNYDLGTQQLTSSGIPVQLPAGGSSLNTIDTANRFGGSERQCLANGHACFYGQECCSGACFRSFCATQITLGIPESFLTRPSVVNGPYVPVNNLDDLITRFGGGSDANAAVQDSSASASLKRANIGGGRNEAQKQCAVVGEGCSRQEDCCSMRCHSYRRKCVT
nr:uncharacterized protein LOC109416092 isoform X2 [Aedes albopictus]